MNMQEIRQLLSIGEKVNFECKEAKNVVPKSIYESYSAFANTQGGTIILGVAEEKSKTNLKERFIIQGVQNAEKLLDDFWNTINGSKVNANILRNEDAYIVIEGNIKVIVIHIPRADYKFRPIYVGENPYKGTFKRNNEGDYHAREFEVNAMIRDQNTEGNDGLVLEYYDMNDIDEGTLKRYRMMFKTMNPDHVWADLEDKEFLENLGAYRKDRGKGIEGLTLAGLMMFGKGLAIRDEFDNVFMDYRDESGTIMDMRWSDRVTYDGTWENNLFNFFVKVSPKLTSDLKKPFKLEGNVRIDDTPVHKAVREAFVNMVIHADYLMDAGVLKVIKNDDGFFFTNPGILKLPKEQIYRGGDSKTRNGRMQTMLRMVGFGDNAGSGFPAILKAWKNAGWQEPELIEDTQLNQVTLALKTKKADKESGVKRSQKGAKKEPKRSRKGAEKEPKGNPKRAENKQNYNVINNKKQDVNNRKQAILDLLIESPKMTQVDIAGQLKLTRKQVQTAIKELQNDDLLIREGSNRNGRWVVKRFLTKR